MRGVMNGRKLGENMDEEGGEWRVPRNNMEMQQHLNAWLRRRGLAGGREFNACFGRGAKKKKGAAGK